VIWFGWFGFTPARRLSGGLSASAFVVRISPPRSPAHVVLIEWVLKSDRTRSVPAPSRAGASRRVGFVAVARIAIGVGVAFISTSRSS